MRWNRILTTIGAVAVLVAGVTVHGCSKNKSTNPTPNPNSGGVELASGTLANGGAYDHTFARDGTFPYHCVIHGTVMSGQVIVSASGTNMAATVNIVASPSPGAYSPASITIKTGGS